MTVRQVQMEEIIPVSDEAILRGLSAFVDQQERERYGLAAPDVLSDLPSAIQTENLGFYLRRIYDSTGWQAISRRAIEALQIV